MHEARFVPAEAPPTIAPDIGRTITGPAWIDIECASGQGITAGFITFKLIVKTVSPDKTVLLTEGTTAQITLQSSTNLVDWISSQPGTYINTNSPNHLFFRLKADLQK